MVRVFHIHIPGRTLILAFTEGLVIVLALVLATYSQFGSDARLFLTYEHMLVKVVAASIVGMICMHYHDLYQSGVLRSPGAVFSRLLQAAGAACVISGTVYYTLPATTFGFDLVITWIALAGVGLSIWRIAFLRINKSRRLRDRALFLGDSPLRLLLVREIESRPELGLQLVGYVGGSGLINQPGDLHRLGEEADLSTIVKRERVNHIIVGNTPPADHLHMKDSRKGGVLVQDAEDLYEAIFDKVSVLANGPLSMTKRAYNISGRIILYKEISSVIVAAAGLLLALPIMILTAIAIRLDSPGPAIFRQNRVGKKGQIFTLYKFRSMRQGVDRDGISPPAQKNDSRFTRVGRLIRRTRIDELPQLWNIVRGDMYLVGPRPFTVDMEDSLSRKIPHYGDRWLVKPGVTGWAQIRRPYCTSVEDNIDKLAHDLFYIKNMSVGFDLLIIFETFKILLLGRGAQ